ncbi:unnamed protein product [Ranitomeya imitator]|uniref:Ubinuclein middle domain-containing protein n=1 Tax=Ranitomeya imitator TaxID=111125 RepID=A0ABN9L2V2_9NEOB|nr:unnamed protein product [Ranitomeya imitator]
MVPKSMCSKKLDFYLEMPIPGTPLAYGSTPSVIFGCLQPPNRVVAFNAHKPDKKKKKLYKDSMALAAMLQKFQKEKDAMRKNDNKPNPSAITVVPVPSKPNPAPVSNDLSDLTLGNDPVLALFGGGTERELLQEAECALEMFGDFDLDKLLDSASNESPAASDQGENGNMVQLSNPAPVQTPKQVPLLPEGLPVQLEKRIEDLRTAAKMFDEEGRKKFFTQEMNNILLDIELQLQEVGKVNRNGVYGYIEAFVPCTKDTLVKRLKKLHLHIQKRDIESFEHPRYLRYSHALLLGFLYLCVIFLMTRMAKKHPVISSREIKEDLQLPVSPCNHQKIPS